MSRGDRGSTLPLVLGFFLVALLIVAGSVAAGDAFVQQRSLQDECDGAAAAAAASAIDPGRSGELQNEHALTFADVEPALADYLARDPDRRGVRIRTAVSPDGRTLTLQCEQTERIAFGAMFGKGNGVRHVVRSSAQAPVLG
jgi:hypothetical protein